MPILACNKWVYVHMPKTGGTWVEHFLIHELGGTIYPHVGGHASVTEIPAHVREGKILFGTIRDPWSWYASWYVHALHVREEWLREYGGGSVDFPEILQGVLFPSPARCPKNHVVIWGIRDLPRRRASFLSSGAGLYSWAVNHIYGNEVENLVRMDDLTKNLSTFLRVAVDPKKYPPRNVSSRKPTYRSTDDLYTDELRELVWERDRVVAERLGYTL